MVNIKLRNTKNVVIWSRVSTKKQEENGGSLDYQRKKCEQYAAEHGYKVVGYYGGTHESAKAIGKLCREMINAVKKDMSISKIICSQFDRLSRSRGEAIKLMDDFRAMGVSIVEASTGTETNDATMALLACFKFSQATTDNEMRVDKFYNGRKHCYESGAYTGVLPLGYTRVDPKTGVKTKSLGSYCYLDENGKKIRSAFRWKMQGYTNGQILDMLSKMGLNITKQTLNHIFNNVFYAGKIRSRMIENDSQMVDGKIEKAVSYEDWLLVQKIMSDKSGKYKHKKRVEEVPLKGYVLCSECGKPLTAYIQKGCWYYKCNTKGCKFNMSAVKLHRKYQEVLESLDFPQELCELYQEMLTKMIKEGNEESVQQATLLRKQRTETEKKISICKTRYALGEIESEVYLPALANLEEKLKEIDAELEKYVGILSNYQNKLDKISLICSNTSSYWKTSDLETRKRIQKLAFPDGIFYDREKGNYRTSNKNVIYNVIAKLSMSYKQKEGEKPSDFSPSVKLCAG